MRQAILMNMMSEKWGLIIPNIKPAGVRCIQLSEDNGCLIFGRPERPAFCAGLQPSLEMCGSTREQAMVWLATLERATAPA